MCLFRKKNKNLVFWCISDKKDPNIIYTFTNTFAEISEYLLKLYVYQYRYDHFLTWCESRNKDKSNLLDINEYVQALEINLFDYYNIGTVEYSQHNMASLFRIFNQCVPLNCSFETDFEREAYIELLNQEKQKTKKKRKTKDVDK